MDEWRQEGKVNVKNGELRHEYVSVWLVGNVTSANFPMSNIDFKYNRDLNIIICTVKFKRHSCAYSLLNSPTPSF